MRVNRKADIQSFLTSAHWGHIILDSELLSDHLAFKLLACLLARVADSLTKNLMFQALFSAVRVNRKADIQSFLTTAH